MTRRKVFTGAVRVANLVATSRASTWLIGTAWTWLNATTRRRISIATLLVSASLPDGLVGFTGTPWWLRYPVRLLLGLVALGLLAEHVRVWAGSNAEPLPRSADPSEQSEPAEREFARQFTEQRLRHSEFVAAQDEQFKDLSSDELAFLADRLAYPVATRPRIIEDAAIGHRQITRTIRVISACPANQGRNSILIPFARPEKGTVLNNLVVMDSAGSPVDCLGYAQTVVLLHATLMLLAGDAAVALVDPDDVDDLSDVFYDLITEHNISSESLADRIEDVCALLGYTTEEEERNAGDSLARLKSVLTVCSSRRPIIGRLPVGAINHATSTAEIRYTYTDGFEGVEVLASLSPGYDQSKQRIRSRILALPNTVSVRVESARACRSYQVRVRAPDGCYIADSALMDLDQGLVAPNCTHGKRYDAFASWPRSSAYGTSELHTANLKRTTMRSPRFLVRIAEVPPGSSGRATIAALSVLLTVWIAGVLFSGVPTGPTAAASTAAQPTATVTPTVSTDLSSSESDGTAAGSAEDTLVSTSDQATDVVAFILGVPAIIGAWYTLSGGAEQKVRSVASRLSFIATALTSLASAILYLIHSQRPDTVLALPDARNVLFVQEWLWSFLLYLAIANFVIISCTTIIRIKRFRHVLRPGEIAVLDATEDDRTRGGPREADIGLAEA